MQIHSPFFGLDRTGGTLVLLRYLTRLAEQGNDISITTLGRSGDERFVDPPEPFHVEYLGLRSKAYKAAIRLSPMHWPFPRLEWQRLRRATPSADLHIVGYSLNLRPVLDRDEPLLYHVQHFEPLITNGRIAQAAAYASYQQAPYITANCTWVADQVTRAGGRVRAVIPPGFDGAAFSFLSPQERDDSIVRVLTLGKAVAWKGLTDVVEAIRLLADRIPRRRVELHSYGPDRPVGDLGRATLVHHGFVDAERLASLQRTATLSVVGSWYESFPLPPLEAMASGTPVITTRIGTEDYARDHENCIVVPSKDPEGMARAMELLVGDEGLRIQLAEEGVKTASNFSWRRAETAFAEAVQDAVGTQSR